MIRSAPTSARAQCTTLRRKTTSSDESTRRPANKKNTNVEKSITSGYCARTITIAVTATLSKAAGSIIFQPRRIT